MRDQQPSGGDVSYGTLVPLALCGSTRDDHVGTLLKQISAYDLGAIVAEKRLK